MDISRWTIDERMCLPDWCFGNRELNAVYVYNNIVGSRAWGISAIPLPDPVCIWEFSYFAMESAGNAGNYRAGLANKIPTTEAEMNEAVEIYPYFGLARDGPNLVIREQEAFTYLVVPFRKGMVTGGKYLVVENYCVSGSARISFSLLVSSLPTNISGWLADAFFKEVR